MKVVIALAVVLLLIALLAVGSGYTGGGAGPALTQAPVDTDHVEMPPSYRFDPPVIRVKVGTTVTWHNGDNFTHSVRLLDGSAGDQTVPPGGSVSIKFDKPGEFAYTCSFHTRDMNGKVIVVP